MSAQVPASRRRSPEEGTLPGTADADAVPTDHLDLPAPPSGRPRRRLVVSGVAAVLVAVGGTAAASGLLGRQAAVRPSGAVAAAGVRDATGNGVVSARTARREGGARPEREAGQVDPLAPLPKVRAKVVAPVAGKASGAGRDARDAAGARSNAEDQMTLPEPTGAASEGSNGSVGNAGVRDLSPETATALPNGVALPPLEAPEAVMQVIRAGNTIARTPYKWGGGHGNFQDSGYDCSGSVTFALYSAGLIGGSATSGQLMSYGRPGPGRWITLYTNPGHVFMVVAGIRFDTVGRARTGSRWQNEMVATGGYVARHPPGY